MPGFDSFQGEFDGDLYFTATKNLTGVQSSYLPFVACFAFVVLIFSLVSQRTAKLFQRFEPLTADTLDILGSIAGILSFLLISHFQLPASIWFGLCGLIFLLAMPRSMAWAALPITLAGGLVALAIYQDGHLLSDETKKENLVVKWSPYQKVEFLDVEGVPQSIFVNGIAHQTMKPDHKLLNSFYQTHYQDRKDQNKPAYRSALIIGSGSGNDIATALINEVQDIDAVEIDPAIAAIGKKFHPLQPYADPRVHLTIDDGRAFMQRSKKKYDLIIFALTDSIVKVSSMSQLRLENFLFTEQAVATAFNLLADDGDIVFYNLYRKDWIVGKIEGMIKKATHRNPRLIYRLEDFAVLKVGRSDPEIQEPIAIQAGIDLPEDNWPFLYLKEKSIPSYYLYAMLVIMTLIGSLFVVLRKRGEKEGVIATRPFILTKWAFVMMGMAFLLLQTKSVIQFSLLFGTTWINSSIVFLSVLTLILLANWTAQVFKAKNLHWGLFIALVGSASLPLFIPLSILLEIESTGLRVVLASLFTFSPIFFANLIFSFSFRTQKAAEQLFGWNLLGAMAGGVLEYFSMLLGYNLLAVVVMVLYAAVFMLLFRAQSESCEKLDTEMPDRVKEIA
ncbi:MAG: hypothetical protein COV44_00045 [Deltaproteobacteria bacterium CG11_big_fil_rev_8_21_14_0_20_45_16]|nr:MAG: hypothetical protein COV44_00045 [Deltaproteobacteria bacterium CG11_big_fil_rev_8_21_14_0_20_45_16]